MSTVPAAAAAPAPAPAPTSTVAPTTAAPAVASTQPTATATAAQSQSQSQPASNTSATVPIPPQSQPATASTTLTQSNQPATTTAPQQPAAAAAAAAPAATQQQQQPQQTQSSQSQPDASTSAAATTAPAASSSSSAATATATAAPAAASRPSGYHSFMVNACKFTVDSRYAPLKPLGRGAYGVVCSATDKSTGRKVAIKKVPKAFDDLVDAKRILREIKLLRHFHHENIVGLRDLIGPVEGEIFEDIYIVLDFMETDLHKIIYSKNELTDEHIQYFIYQVLRGLKFIHSSHVIHRDLKPSNLLLNGNCDLKICDFGLARGTKEDADYELTEYVVTRWYRAPEVMCSCQEYDHKIDVWSVGCILAELHGRKPLFPGDDYIKQMNLIFSVLGTPSKLDMKFITNEKALEYIKSLKKQAKIPFNKIYKDANPLALDLLDRMLVFNPNNRISVSEALSHPYFKGLHNPKSEIDCKIPFDFEFEKIEMTKEVLQEFMWQEIINFRPELATKTWKITDKKQNAGQQQQQLPSNVQSAQLTQSATTAAPAPSTAPATVQSNQTNPVANNGSSSAQPATVVPATVNAPAAAAPAPVSVPAAAVTAAPATAASAAAAATSAAAAAAVPVAATQ